MPLRVGEREVVQRHLAEHRAFDPADWTWRPEAVSKALIWRTMKRRPGSVFSQSRKAPSRSDQAEQDDAAPIWRGHGRMAAADDDGFVRHQKACPIET